MWHHILRSRGLYHNQIAADEFQRLLSGWLRSWPSSLSSGEQRAARMDTDCITSCPVGEPHAAPFRQVRIRIRRDMLFWYLCFRKLRCSQNQRARNASRLSPNTSEARERLALGLEQHSDINADCILFNPLSWKQPTVHCAKALLCSKPSRRWHCYVVHTQFREEQWWKETHQNSDLQCSSHKLCPQHFRRHLKKECIKGWGGTIEQKQWKDWTLF